MMMGFLYYLLLLPASKMLCSEGCHVLGLPAATAKLVDDVVVAVLGLLFLSFLVT